MSLLPRTGTAARQNVLAQRLRLQVRLERTAEGQLERAFRQAVGAMGDFHQHEVDTALAALSRKVGQLLTTLWRVAAHSTAEQVLVGLEELRKTAGAPHERKERTAEQRLGRRVLEWITEFAADRITAISEATRQAAQDVIRAGREANDTTDEIRRALEESPGFTRARAAVIARTEVHAASSAGADLAAQAVSDETGVGLKREWLAAEDDRTRSAHAEADGQVRGMDEPFQFEDDQGAYTLDRPGDPDGPARGVINCRCALGYLPT